MKLKDQPAKPFRDTHTEQVKLLGESTIHWGRLTETLLRQLVTDIYSRNDLFDTERMDNLVHNISVNVQRIMARRLV